MKTISDSNGDSDYHGWPTETSSVTWHFPNLHWLSESVIQIPKFDDNYQDFVANIQATTDGVMHYLLITMVFCDANYIENVMPDISVVFTPTSSLYKWDTSSFFDMVEASKCPMSWSAYYDLGVRGTDAAATELETNV